MILLLGWNHPYFHIFFFFSWILLEVLDKVSPGSVNWKQATKPPIKMPFRKVENCNQVIKIGKQLKLSLVNVAGNDFVQGNKKLILGNILKSCYFHIYKYSFGDYLRYLPGYVSSSLYLFTSAAFLLVLCFPVNRSIGNAVW